MREVIYKGTDKTLPFTLSDDAGEPIVFAGREVTVELNVKDRVVGLFSTENDTVKEGSVENECKICLLSADTVKYPVGMLRAVITVAFEDPDYPGNTRREIVAVEVFQVSEAK